ncbi:MAG: hypothetical protein WA628_19435 [Terriglobales bacterium]
MGAHVHLVHDRRVGHLLGPYLAGIGIVILSALGLYNTLSSWLEGHIAAGLLALGFLVGPACVYAFGYFWCMPDVLGGTAHDASRNLLQRWTDFALLSAFIALLVTGAIYVRVIWLNFSYVELARAVAIVLACLWMPAVCVLASEKYLGWTMPTGDMRSRTGWRARVRRAMRVWASWPVKLLGSQTSCAIGGVLSLLSLILVVDHEIFGPSFRGYQIIAGGKTSAWAFDFVPGDWPTVHNLNMPFLADAHRAVYVLALLVAALVLASVLPGRWGSILRGNRILTVLAATIALLEVTDVALSFGYELFGKWAVAAWLIGLAVPVALWLRAAHGARDDWDRTRVAILVFYLPIFLLCFAYLVLFAYFGAGFGAFIAGSLLVWWGLVQSEGKSKLKSNAHEA